MPLINAKTMRSTKVSLLTVIFFGVLFISCDNTNSTEPAIYEKYTGVLKWGGHPAVDGSGLLLLTGNKTYGVPGDKKDYNHIFKNDESEADVRVDFALTDKKTVRGWGATFTEIQILNIERLPNALK